VETDALHRAGEHTGTTFLIWLEVLFVRLVPGFTGAGFTPPLPEGFPSHLALAAQEWFLPERKQPLRFMGMKCARAAHYAARADLGR